MRTFFGNWRFKTSSGRRWHWDSLWQLSINPSKTPVSWYTDRVQPYGCERNPYLTLLPVVWPTHVYHVVTEQTPLKTATRRRTWCKGHLCGILFETKTVGVLWPPKDLSTSYRLLDREPHPVTISYSVTSDDFKEILFLLYPYHDWWLPPVWTWTLTLHLSSRGREVQVTIPVLSPKGTNPDHIHVKPCRKGHQKCSWRGDNFNSGTRSTIVLPVPCREGGMCLTVVGCSLPFVRSLDRRYLTPFFKTGSR